MQCKLSAFSFIEICAVLMLVALVWMHPEWKVPDTSRIVLSQQSYALASWIHFSKFKAFFLGEPLYFRPLVWSDDGAWEKGVCLMRLSTHECISTWHFSSPDMRLFWRGFQSRRGIMIGADPDDLAMNGTFLCQHKRATLHLVLNRLGRIKQTWVTTMHNVAKIR